VAEDAGVKAEEPEPALETALDGPPGLLRVVLSVEYEGEKYARSARRRSSRMPGTRAPS